MSKRPIEPQPYMYGVKVVNIGDVRVSRGMTRVARQTCEHSHIVYDEAERRVYCEDCEEDVEAFDAFLLLVVQQAAAWKSINRARNEISEAQSHEIRSRAARLVDKAWRTRKMVPNCPHCSEALLPEDFINSTFRTSSAELARKKREKAVKQ